MLTENASKSAGFVNAQNYFKNHVLESSERLLEPRVAAVELIGFFRSLAAALSPLDASLQDDLVQEMCLAALECTHASERTYYEWLAGWRAKDYLRWWLSPMKKQRPAKPEIDENEWAA